jgi:glc operon protein GlcG
LSCWESRPLALSAEDHWCQGRLFAVRFPLKEKQMKTILMSLLVACAFASANAQAELPSKKVLTLSAAKKIAEAAEAEAKKRGSTVVIVVVDDGGHLLVLHRLDDTQVASVEVGIGKARTAAIFRRPSKDFEDQVRNGRVAALALPGATPLQGGVPIYYEGKVIGAIGVSGNTPQEDEDIAKAGAAATLTAIQGADELLTAVTFITGKEGREEELKNELLKLSAPTRAEAGNLKYDLYQSPLKPNHFMRLEVWRNPQALEDHKATPHLKASFAIRQQQGWMTEITTWKRVREEVQPQAQAKKDGVEQ